MRNVIYILVITAIPLIVSAQESLPDGAHSPAEKGLFVAVLVSSLLCAFTIVYYVIKALKNK